MDNIQYHFVKKILANAQNRLKPSGSAFAPSNIALCKYWGKRDAQLNLPVNSSLSISLGQLGTHTELHLCDGDDRIYLNGVLQPAESGFVRRMSTFLDLFRPAFNHAGFEVRTDNNIPTAAGLASSASGFAALVKALDELAGWGLDAKERSMLARIGSGSASRSVYDGFAQWHAGIQADGMDSFAERIDNEWPEFRIGILELTSAPKSVGSREGMNRTVETSDLYKSWPDQADTDLATLHTAIDEHNFSLLGKTAERNALAMHATMMAAWPPLVYLRPESVEQIHKVQRVRSAGLEVYLTIDAGPNIKLLFLGDSEPAIHDVFADVRVVAPFSPRKPHG